MFSLESGVIQCHQFDNKELENEEFCFLIGKIESVGNWFGYSPIKSIFGSAYRVEFDSDLVFHYENKYKNVIGFFHTHPHSLAYPSNIDIKTMCGWCLALGKDLICVIRGNDGLKAFLFYKGQDFFHEIVVKKIDNFLMGRILETDYVI